MNFPHKESRLLAAVATGDRQAFTQIYSTYLHGLQRYIFLFTHSEETAQELAQQVFIAMWERRAQLPAIASFQQYLYRAAKNLVYDEVRQQQRQLSVYAEVHAVATSCGQSADQALINQQYHEQAQALIQQLPTKRRQIFLLRTQEELSLDEIAQRLDISKSVVKKQLYAAIDYVKKNLLLHSDAVVQLAVCGLLPTLF